MVGTTTSSTSARVVRPQLAVGDWITASARKHPDRSCLVDHAGGSRTFRDVDERTTRLAWELRAGGLQPGDRIAILGVDSIEHVEVILACLKAGIVFCDLNYRLSPSEIAASVDLIRPSAFVVDGRYAEHVPDGAPMFRLDGAGPTSVSTMTATARVAGPDLAGAVAHGEQIVSIALTSGTTGRPKAVLQSERMIRNLVHVGLREFRVRIDDFRYSAAPIFHIAGIGWIYYGILSGASSLVLPQFDAATTVHWLAEGGLTNCLLVPTMLTAVLDVAEQRGVRFSGLRSITYGGAPMTPPLLRRVADVFDCDLFNSYGAGTEAGPAATLYPEDHRAATTRPELLESVGRPVAGVDLRVCDDDGHDVGTGSLGEIVLRSEMIMSGYVGQPPGEWPIVDGWFHTGDIGRLDRDGFVYLAGRRSDMIIRGGENIFPAEAQAVLEQHPAVAEVAVVGLADDYWGQIVAAAIVVAGGAAVAAEDLAAFCREQLAAYKVPTRYLLVDELPKNSTGKVTPAAVSALFERRRE